MGAPPMRSSVSVARLGSNVTVRLAIDAATRAAVAPLIRTTPIPPRPGGVAIATMVSEGENMLLVEGTEGTEKIHNEGTK
jgi:hypothetical protein